MNYIKEFLFLVDSITDCDHSFDPQNLGEGYVRILAKELGHFDGTVNMRNMGWMDLLFPLLLAFGIQDVK